MFPKEFPTGREAPQQGLPAPRATKDAAAAQLLKQHLATEVGAEAQAALLELLQVHGTFSGKSGWRDGKIRMDFCAIRADDDDDDDDDDDLFYDRWMK